MKKPKYDLVIKSGRVIDPAFGFGKEADVFVKEGRIAKIARESKVTLKEISSLPEENIIDASGKIVCPGLIDMHVHFREPGFEGKETIITG
ncbi:MAG: hypothetical protein DRP46_10320, partial [Candidatus Zixiibacteriota bacterium]